MAACRAGRYPPGVRIRQYAYFALQSEITSAAEMTGVIGVEPDRFLVRGARRTVPRVAPPLHSWQVRCCDAGLTVDEQVGRVIGRLLPYQDRIAQLAARLADEPGGSAWLSVVRYFNDADGEEELDASPHPQFEKLTGQHQLLGWALDASALGFLVAVGAHLDVDEYDCWE